MSKNSDYILIVSNLLKYEECFLDGLKSVTINENLTNWFNQSFHVAFHYN